MRIRDGWRLLAGLLVVTGCASGGSWDGPTSEVRIGDGWGGVPSASSWLESGAATRRGIARPSHQVWTVLELAYGRLAIPVTHVSAMESEIHTVGARVRRLAGSRLGDFFDCGQDRFGPLADQYDVRLNLRTAVRSREDGGSELVMHVHATAEPRGGLGEPVLCTSRSRLEDRLHREVQSMLGIEVGPVG